MAVDSEIEAHLKDLFEPLGYVTFRKMFGGLGIFRHGLSFALYSSQGILALQADDQTKADFEAEGMPVWNPHADGRSAPNMGYWHAPERLMEEPDELLLWAERAFQATARLDAKTPQEQRKLTLI